MTTISTRLDAIEFLVNAAGRSANCSAMTTVRSLAVLLDSSAVGEPSSEEATRFLLDATAGGPADIGCIIGALRNLDVDDEEFEQLGIDLNT